MGEAKTTERVMNAARAKKIYFESTSETINFSYELGRKDTLKEIKALLGDKKHNSIEELKQIITNKINQL